jgi:endonuclease/exonuclease/phosphatase (EEP) superfamily protein YafD
VTLLYANLWDDNPTPGRLRAMLRAAGADIVITSETTRAVTDGAAGLRARYPYRLVSTAPGATLRTAIWSKFPLRQGSLFLDNNVAPTGASAAAEIAPGLQLGLIGVHFSRAAEGLRRAQTDALGPIADRLPRPLVVIGDFNAAPWSWVARHSAAVTGTRILGGHRITWKGAYPTPAGPVPALWGQQIDHVLVSDGVGVEAVTTIVLPGSDHRGLQVRLRIAPGLDPGAAGS